jgi:acetolactate synthase-1/2/3 large subunit
MTAMTGARFLAGALESYGVDAVFLVPTILSKTLFEMEQRTGIRRIVTHGEKAAAYMADGYARASGRLGVCMAQTVGGANLAAGLRDAYLACTPVAAITGGPFTWSRHRAQYQEIEDFPLFKQVTKSSAHVPDAGRLPDLLAQAVRTAVSGKPGPVHLEFPGHAGEVIEDGELDAAVPAGPVRMPPFRFCPDGDALRHAVRLLSEAQRPVLVAGGGVSTSGARADVVALAERLDIPVATSMNGKDTLPSGHPLNIGVPGLYARASANHVLLEADLVFYVGSQAGSQVTLNWQVPPLSARTMHLDIEPAQLGRHYPDATVLLGDARTTLRAMLDIVESGGPGAADRRAWRARVDELGRRWAESVSQRMTSDDVPIRPERLLHELNGTLPDDAIVVVDTGHAGMWGAGYLDLKSPGQGFLRAAGSLGWALPASLGAKLAQPDRSVVLLTGDGGFWYHVAELETAARWNIGTVMVVNDNRSLKSRDRAVSGRLRR